MTNREYKCRAKLVAEARLKKQEQKGVWWICGEWEWAYECHRTCFGRKTIAPKESK